MSKSVGRVRAALQRAGITSEILELAQETRTAQMAADVVGCDLDQIAKSIIFLGRDSGQCLLFITAGGRRVSEDKAAMIANEPLAKADAAQIRAQTGFAIGGVSPIGHLFPCPKFFDETLLGFATIWAAAGTPRHIFPISPDQLLKITGAQLAEITT